MSERVQKCVKSRDLRPFKSDPDLLNNNDANVVLKREIKNIISPLNNNLRRCEMEKLNNSLDLDLGVSVLKDSQMDLSQLADVMVSKSLFCPFCGVDFMFEFSLKDHLKKVHMNEILEISSKKRSVSDDAHLCPYCKAVFYHFVLIPLHIGHHHAENLQIWQQTEGNMNELKNQKNECPSMELIACSPGMSDLLKSMDISGKVRKRDGPKSILKRKTNMSGRIIFSPSSASLRRIGEDHSKRNTSARRELRFDLPAQEHNYSVEPSDPLYRLRESPTPKKRKWKLFTTKPKPKKSQKRTKVTSNMITSTPIGFLDSTDSLSRHPLLKKPPKWAKIFKFHTKVGTTTKEDSFLPSFYASEKYKCAICKQKFEDNAELRYHLKEKHYKILAIFRPQYECGQCFKRFYRNNRLVHHCHYQHTPQKHRSSL